MFNFLRTVTKIEEPARRFATGFVKMGASTKKADTRTTEQLLKNIDYYAEKMPEISQFKTQLKSMEPKYLGLVSDICELAERKELLPTNIDMRKPVNGKNLLQVLMEQLPIATKESLDFTKEVINQTDMLTSKYFLAESCNGIMKNLDVRKQFASAISSIKGIAENTINCAYTMSFEPQKNFMDFIKLLVNKNADAEKVKLLPKICETVDKISSKDYTIYVDKFVNSNSPASKVEENLPYLTSVVRNAEAQGKEIDVIDFLLNNTNLTK